MKKLFLVLLLLLIGLLGFTIYKMIIKKTMIEKKVLSMPKFSFETLDKKPFTKDSLSNVDNIILIFFNSECDICEHEILSIEKNIQYFNHSEILFVSTQSFETLEEYINNMKTKKFNSLKWLHSDYKEVECLFKIRIIPTILIYDENGHLQKKYEGATGISDIIKYLKK